MKIPVTLVIIFFILSFSVYGQEKDSLKYVSPFLNLQGDIEIAAPEYNLQNPLEFDELLPGSVDSNSVWLWTSYSISKPGRGTYLPGAPEPHMLANYHDMIVENSKFNMVKTVIGLAQAGFVGYLAVKSVQKHGFWNNK
jgi:hypothetical protein